MLLDIVAGQTDSVLDVRRIAAGSMDGIGVGRRSIANGTGANLSAPPCPTYRSPSVASSAAMSFTSRAPPGRLISC
jgi:hypothetical protein